MRKALGRCLGDLFARDSRHHVFCGDIGYGVFDDFAERLPEQFHNSGISEQHMTSFAGAFAKTIQATSLIYTITPFITSRVHDQLRVDVAYANAPLIVCSVGGGFAYDVLGYTHYGLDDLALIGVLPNITIITPSEPDDVTNALTRLMATECLRRPCYLQLHKGGEPSLKERFGDFLDGPGFRYWPGTEVEIITHGVITGEALAAREMLAGEISVGVRTVIDWSDLFASAVLSGVSPRVLFVEEHRNSGLLAQRLLASGLDRPFAIACVDEADFPVCVARSTALKLNGLDAGSLVDRIRRLVNLTRT